MEYRPGGEASELKEGKAEGETEGEAKGQQWSLPPPSIPSTPGMPPGEYGKLTNVRYTTVPVPDIIIPELYDAWKINPRHKMCIIFDAVNPCRQFKRGEVYDEDLEDPFAEYEPNADDDPNVTDTDVGDTQPYAPITYTRVQ